MKLLTPLIFFCFISINIYSQIDSTATKLLSTGIELFKHKKYDECDSIFSLALKNNPNSNIFFYQALTKLKKNDTCQFCSNMQFASKFGHPNAEAAYEQYCEKSKTFEIKNPNDPKIRIVNVIKTQKCTNQNIYTFYKIENEDTIYRSTEGRIDKGFIVDIIKKDSGIITKFIKKIDTLSKPVDNYVTTTPEGIITVIEEMACFPGGLEGLSEYLRMNIKYPNSAREYGIEGYVYLEFQVDSAGKVGDIILLKGTNSECDQEAFRVVQDMPDWIPAKINGIPVTTNLILPIMFRLL